MQHNIKSIRPFLGAKDYKLSCSFYRDLGFEEKVLFPNMCVFKSGEFAFYLQDAYVKDWVDNTQVFMEVGDVEKFWSDVVELDLPSKYDSARLAPIRHFDWGSECYIHDPSGILWHVGHFNQ